jgi:hippurate hydrolase
MLDAIHRICCAEADASGAPQPPDFENLSRYPLTENDAAAAARVADAFHAEFGDAAHEARRASASEDFSEFGRAWNVPYVFWFVGGTDPATYAKAAAEGSVRTIPSNHSPRFAPVLEPTFEVGARERAAP